MAKIAILGNLMHDVEEKGNKPFELNSAVITNKNKIMKSASFRLRTEGDTRILNVGIFVRVVRIVRRIVSTIRCVL